MNNNEQYFEGSVETDKIRLKAIDGLYCEEFNDFLNNVINFLNKNGYITKSQYLNALNCKLKSIHE